MHPVLHIFGLELAAYPLFTLLGAIAAAALAFPSLRRLGLCRTQAAGLLAVLCAGYLIGARLWNVAISPNSYLGAFKWYTLRLTGLSMYGGVLGAGLVLLAAMHLWKKPVWPAMDGMTVPGGVAFCIARVGCFLNGCCAGRATSCALGVVFPVSSAAQKAVSSSLPFLRSEYPVHPTQLYELAGAALGLPLIYRLCRRLHLRQGALFLLYAAWFSAVRLAILPLRALPYRAAVKTIVYPLLYLLVIAAGIGMTILRGRRNIHETGGSL